MDYLQIRGGKKLSSMVTISGAKNAALPVIAATILSDKPVMLTNLPNVVDIHTLLKLLDMLGGKVKHEETVACVDNSTINSHKAVYEIVAQMRASILVLGPLLARFGECEVSLPGGCAIGQRPIDLHLKALEAMGAIIEIKGGYVHAVAPKGGLSGTKIIFDTITVGGTENTLMAAALASGTTTIINAAKEPEIVQLCKMLTSAGVKVDGIGTNELIIEGTNGIPLTFPEIEIIPDRIEAGTYLCAGAITNSEITLEAVNPEHMRATIDKLESMGFGFTIKENTITIHPAKKICPVNIVTVEYPGFPTDMQAQLMAVAVVAKGESLIEERLFENRFMHVSELNRLGADIWLKGNTAAIKGVEKLHGADVMATDLRASSALVLAGLVAEGTTNIRRIYHLDRGYDNLEGKLVALGADIVRKKA
ncbi:MAG: UDP-N-acetylglucosamine 1-carboxyvinyltransferase [Sulfurovum sp.]|nr:UDP-N-acetylglucosamine 1-carboxyvinyltransferase [Sulfurovum sp.]MCB4744332.1 UDP-N-acetylglucosamine 1-carboxyvinyltransferase [Sulfurovum sp.]MCB4746315.1 UDP-N-acetylglucosamine 1-carboxyvinyltransferase [Sulfurovum sp.]MCB4748763.1 UDP-N-acetylglucosamine 1-carboxyvinyltransferase [Sulfurovum sp.]MCB4750935.1 UDP-N-acetylglucosamine 1-carboxyvinyltransferase [Sulfurovum sp.]